MQLENQASPVGAVTLLESRAFFIERSLGPEEHARDPLVAASEAGEDQYFLCFLALAQTLMETGIEDVHAIFDTYLLLSELALYTPLGRTYGRFRRAESWAEAHPGWRFRGLLRVVPQIGPFRRGVDQDVFEYQERYSRAMGWPKPQEMLEAGANLAPRNFRERRHALACRKKLEWPELFCLPSLMEDKDYEVEALHAFFSQIYCFCVDPARGTGFTAVSNDIDLAMERLTTAYFQSLGWSYLVTGDPDDFEHLEPVFPYHKILHWEGEGSLARFFDSRARNFLRVVRKVA